MADAALLEKIGQHDPIKAVLYGEALHNNQERSVSVADAGNVQKTGRQQLEEALSGKDELRDSVIKVLAKVEEHASVQIQDGKKVDFQAYMDAAQVRLAKDISSGEFQTSLENYQQIQVAENNQRAGTSRQPIPEDWAQKSAVTLEKVHVERDLDNDLSR